MKKELILLSLVLLVSLQLGFLKTVQAFYNTPVVIGQITDTAGTSIVANMGGSVQLNHNGPSTEEHPQYYAGLESHPVSTAGVCNERITVTGTDPAGTALTGQRFVPLSVIHGPVSNSLDKQNILFQVFNVLLNALPYGIGSDVQNAQSYLQSTPPPTDYPGNTAYGDWTPGSPFDCTLHSSAIPSGDSSINFGFQLQVDTSLPGTYTMQVDYHVKIAYLYDNGIGFSSDYSYKDLYQTFYYCYKACSTHYYSISASPSSVSVNSAASSTSTITITSTNSLSSLVGLQATTSDPSVQASLSPQTVDVPSGGAASSTLTVSTSYATCNPGTYSVTVYDQNGLNDSVTIPVTETCPPGFSLSANPSSVLVCPTDAYAGSMVTVTSLSGFSGNVYMSGSPYDSTLSTFSAWPQWASVNIPAGGSKTDSFNLVGGNNPYPQPGDYTFTLTGTSGSVTASTQVTMHVSGMNPCCLNQNGCGGGGGSVADGTLITMADGRRVPVQNLNAGDEMLGYNITTGQFATSVVNSIKVVDTPNQLIIHTASGTPFRVDANPHQKLWVKNTNGTTGWVSVTQIVAGDDLFTVNGWTLVTGINFAPAGNHIMYDITSSMPYFASGYLDPISKT